MSVLGYALDALRVLRSKLAGADVALMDRAIADVEAVAVKLEADRERARVKKRRQRGACPPACPGDGPGDEQGDGPGDTGGDEPPQTPRSGDDLSLNSATSPEKENQNGERDKNTRDQLSPGQTLEQQVLAKRPGSTPEQVAEVAANLIERAGFPKPDAKVDLEHLTWIAQQPRLDFTRVLTEFRADRFYTSTPRAVTPKQIRGRWSAMLMPAQVKGHTMSEAVVPTDERQKRISDIEGKLRSERALLATASDAGRPRLLDSIAWLEAELARLTAERAA